MAGGQNGVGEVRVMPDRLHAFTMAICRADGSSEAEAKLVADHLVLANLFGHDSHGVGKRFGWSARSATRSSWRVQRSTSWPNGRCGWGVVCAQTA